MAMETNAGEEEPSYVDYETFLAPDFSAPAFANALVVSTNNASDTPIDLSTPLSRVLFDIQEIDSHIDVLTTRSAIPLLSHTREQTEASARIVAELDGQARSLHDSYRQLEVQHAELLASSAAGAGARKEDHGALVRSSHTILSLRQILEHKAPGEEGHGLDGVVVVRTLRDAVVAPVERSIRDTCERIVREFSMGSAAGSATFAQSEETRARTVSALVTLFLVSPTALAKGEKWTPAAMLQALEAYLAAALQSSVTSLARSLAALPSLERTLAEVGARCQNIVALEMVLESTRAPAHPLRAVLSPSAAAVEKGNLLQTLLAHLETGSLASYFWRTLASRLSTRVQEIVSRGGVAARTLNTNKNSVGEAIRECVVRGAQPPGALSSAKAKGKQAVEPSRASGWEREIAVMVGSVVGNLGR